MRDIKEVVYDVAQSGYHAQMILTSENLIKDPNLARYCFNPKDFLEMLIKYNEYYENYELCAGLVKSLKAVNDGVLNNSDEPFLDLPDIYRQDEHE